MAKGRLLIKGPQVEAKSKYNAEFALPPKGQHLWILVGMWRVSDPKSPQFFLDLENLLTIEGPGCYLCEKTYREAQSEPCGGGMA